MNFFGIYLKHFTPVIALICLLIQTGCATIYSDPKQVIAISSNNQEDNNKPIKIEILHNKSSIASTLPLRIVLRPKSGKKLAIRVVDNCYETLKQEIPESISKYYMLNFLNLHGFYIDYFSGYMWQYPDNIKLQLSPKAIIEKENAEHCGTNNRLPQQLATPSVVTIDTKYSLTNEESTFNLGSNAQFGIGLLSGTTLKEKDYFDSGSYIEFAYHMDERWRISPRFSRTLFGCDWNDIEYISCADNTAVKIKRQTVSISVQYQLFPNLGWYVGIGGGYSTIKQDVWLENKFAKYPNTFNEYNLANASFSPVFIDFGYRGNKDLLLSFFATLSAQQLGLSGTKTYNNTYYPEKFDNPEVIKLARKMILSAEQYSIVGLGLTWRAKNVYSTLGTFTVGLAYIAN